MKTIYKASTALAFVLSIFAFAAFSGTTALAAPITPPGHACLEYNEGGTDCSFTSYAQCEATAAGLDGECYGPTVRNDDFRSRHQRNQESRASSY